MDAAFNFQNPLSDLISDEIYELLIDFGMINKRSVRNYLIKKRFLELKQLKMTASQAIGFLRTEYPDLRYDSIRKIVYKNI
ncbi:MAG: hypothetical protein V1720_20280 [bacterium]